MIFVSVHVLDIAACSKEQLNPNMGHCIGSPHPLILQSKYACANKDEKISINSLYVQLSVATNLPSANALHKVNTVVYYHKSIYKVTSYHIIPIYSC